MICCPDGSGGAVTLLAPALEYLMSGHLLKQSWHRLNNFLKGAARLRPPRRAAQFAGAGRLLRENGTEHANPTDPPTLTRFREPAVLSPPKA
ncbi:hypothetical protein AAFF_G00109920 [Aldrovandia affinis]|uniref:Uncharacterized protein n=1 Tax=Aldrovandia affinis TaxID=143900 RepID=A0AAD7R122_9TELE|nr:hypothetical protein AAFF_G00109920 [Aldrovandia affinis]